MYYRESPEKADYKNKNNRKYINKISIKPRTFNVMRVIAFECMHAIFYLMIMLNMIVYHLA